MLCAGFLYLLIYWFACLGSGCVVLWVKLDRLCWWVYCARTLNLSGELVVPA